MNPEQDTIAEQLLGAPAGSHVIRDIDLTYSHDGTTPLSIESFNELFEGTGREPQLAHPDRVAVVFDHAYPPPTVTYAEHQQLIRAWMDEVGVEHFYAGQGICHLVLAENGHIGTGDIVLGADSHTCNGGAVGAFATGVGSTDVSIAWATGRSWLRVPESLRVELTGELPPGSTAKDICLELARRIGPDGATYLAVEFGGPGWATLGMDARFTLANMVVDMGAKTATCETDEATSAWLRQHGAPAGPNLRAGLDASYTGVVEIDLSSVEALVSGPHRLEALQPARSLTSVTLDRVVIGSCTNGRVDDLRAVAQALVGRSVQVETLVVPGSQHVARQAREEGLLDVLEQAGCTVLASGCGPCLGRHQGVLAPGQACLTTHNRNPPGRMGSPQAEIYLASPLVAAASAVAGHIAPPTAEPIPAGGGA